MMERNYSNKEIIVMKNIAAKLKEYRKISKKLSRLEYFLLGGVSFNIAASMIYRMRENKDITFNEYYLLNEYISIQRNLEVYHRKDSILAIRFIFKDNEISDLQKEVVWNKLINAGIDEKNIDDMVFSAAVREYAIRLGYVKPKDNSKTKTLKK